MNETPASVPAAPRRTSEHGAEIVVDHELVRLARVDIDRFLTLSDFEQRLVLKMAEQLANADRRATSDADQAG